MKNLINLNLNKGKKEIKYKFKKPVKGSVTDFEQIDIKRPKLAKHFLEVICKHDAFICGGYARVICSPHRNPLPTDDIDIYLLEEVNLAKVQKRLEDNNYILNSENDISYIYKPALGLNEYKINLIKPVHTGHLHTFGDLKNILNNFDFTIARIGVYLDEDNNINALADNNFLDDEMNLVLNIKNIHCPIAEIYRVTKYINKGYKAPMIQLLQILQDWESRDDDFKNYLITTFYSDKNLSLDELNELYSVLYID